MQPRDCHLLSNPSARQNNLLGQQCYRRQIFQQSDSPLHPPSRQGGLDKLGGVSGSRSRWQERGKEGERASMQHSRQPDSLPSAASAARAIDKTEKSSVIGEIQNRRFLAVSGAFKSFVPISHFWEVRSTAGTPKLRQNMKHSCDHRNPWTKRVLQPTIGGKDV